MPINLYIYFIILIFIYIFSSPRNTDLSRRNSENNLKSKPVTQINEKFSKALGKLWKWIEKLKISKEKKSVVAPPPPMLKNTPKFDYFKGGPLSEAHRLVFFC